MLWRYKVFINPHLSNLSQQQSTALHIRSIVTTMTVSTNQSRKTSSPLPRRRRQGPNVTQTIVFVLLGCGFKTPVFRGRTTHGPSLCRVPSPTGEGCRAESQRLELQLDFVAGLFSTHPLYYGIPHRFRVPLPGPLLSPDPELFGQAGTVSP